MIREHYAVAYFGQSKEEIEDEIIRANKEKLLQANNTPLREKSLDDLLGEQGDFEKWEEILRGKIKLPDEHIEEGTRLWFEFISNGDVSDLDIMWTKKEFFQSWKKMKEE